MSLKLSPVFQEFLVRLGIFILIALSFHTFFHYYNASHSQTPLAQSPNDYEVLFPTPDKKITDTPTSHVSPHPSQDTEPWGVAKQLDDVTWTLKVQNDAVMATPEEILNALNNYRQSQGREKLKWSDTLASFAKERADHFRDINSTDKHAGFISYLDNEENAQKLGFYGFGENSSFGYKLQGVHLIEWVFAADEGHNANQLNSSWTYVGIGVSGLGIDVIFAKNKRE